jgi:hypothetical protein
VRRPGAIVVVMILSGTAPAFAETPEGRQACMNDAFKVCQDAIPDREKVFNCLAAHKDMISPACRAEVAPTQAAERTAPPPAKMHAHGRSSRHGELATASVHREAIAERKARTKQTAGHAAKPKAKRKIKSTAGPAAPQRSGQPLNLVPR